MTTEEDIQTKPSVQRAGESGEFQAGSSLESRLASQKGGGSSLDGEAKSFMESRFGTDFSSVRVHTGSDAIQMNKELHAQAFTHGSDIYFGLGRYNPRSNEGKRLLAHELTHVVQQTGAGQLQTKRLTDLPSNQENLQAKELVDHTSGVTLNKELRLQPMEEAQEKEPLQAKELPDLTEEFTSNKQLRLQPLEEQEEPQSLQAKELPDLTEEFLSNKQLRLQPLEEQEEPQPFQAKELPNLTSEVSSNKELGLQPLEGQEEPQSLQAKELPDLTEEFTSNKQLRLQPLEEQEEPQSLQTKELPDLTSEVSLNKELGLQPQEEQQEASPLQAKELKSSGGDKHHQTNIDKGFRGITPVEKFPAY